MPPRYKYSAKQWHAIKAKLKKDGKWDDKRAKRDTDGPPEAKKPRIYLHELEEPTREELDKFFDDLQNNPGEFDSSLITSPLTPLMNNVNDPERDFSVGSSSTSGNDTSREIHKTSADIREVHVEMHNDSSQKIHNSELSVLHKRGNSSSEVRETSLSPDRDEISVRASVDRGINGIPRGQEAIRENCLVYQRKLPVKTVSEFNNQELENLNLLEDYFQSYNSIGIVIKSLPGINISSHKMFKILAEAISDPFVIISERSGEGVLHWHMIWLTSKRTDNAKRILQSKLNIISDKFSIACQQTKSFKNLLRYILKEPITLGVCNSQQLLDYCLHILRDTPYKKQDSTSNPMVTDILKAMETYRIYNYEELLKQCPNVMIKYLHKPNLESIIQNCKMFLLKPGNTKLILERAVGNQKLYPFFRIWAFLDHQGIEPGDFILDFYNVFFKLTDKHNVIAIQGGSNAGKTTFIRPLLDLFNFGEVVSGGQFMFQNCINKEILIWEEPLIGHDFVEMCKRVFEGMSTQVPVKYRAPQTLHRTPILITTNKDIWHYSTADEDALRNRMLLYYFTEPAESFRHRDSGWWRQSWESYSRWITKACRYVESSYKDNSTGSEHSQPEGTEWDHRKRKCVHTISQQWCTICCDEYRASAKSSESLSR